MGLKVLVLTDHKNHSAENSLYALVRKLVSHTKCESVWVATRSFKDNTSFFNEHDYHKIRAAQVTSDFAFSPDGSGFLRNLQMTDTSDVDLIFLRLPRPVEDSFLLDLEAHFKNIPIINKPSGIIKCSSKEYLLNFPDLTPPTRLCQSIDEIMDFSKSFPIVLKPLRDYGGKGILKIEKDRFHNGLTYQPIDSLEKMLGSQISEGYIAMKYLKNVSQGDKRLLVVDGQILASSLRLPSDGSWLCNVAAGGASVPSDPTEEEYEMVEKLALPLRSNGILIAGIDTLVSDEGKRVLSEINALSIGGFPQAEQQTGRPILQQTIDAIIDYAINYVP